MLPPTSNHIQWIILTFISSEGESSSVRSTVRSIHYRVIISDVESDNSSSSDIEDSESEKSDTSEDHAEEGRVARREMTNIPFGKGRWQICGAITPGCITMPSMTDTSAKCANYSQKVSLVLMERTNTNLAMLLWKVRLIILRERSLATSNRKTIHMLQIYGDWASDAYNKYLEFCMQNKIDLAILFLHWKAMKAPTLVW